MAQVDVVVLGGGAAGLLCAATAGARGRRVLVLERANRIGKKILMSGGGRCNFTNLDVTPDNFLGANPHFCRSALARYSQWDFIALVDRHGIPWHDKGEGQLFCDNSAKDIVAMLTAECDQAGVEIRVRSEVLAVEQASGGGWRVRTDSADIHCQSLVVATGGLSVPTLGGSGFGYHLAEQLGLPVLPRRAGLVPFTLTDHWHGVAERLSGLATDSRASAGEGSFRGNLLFTHRGLSGPAVLQVSSYWREGTEVAFDLLPEQDASAVLLAAKATHPQALLRTRLGEHLPRNLVAELEQRWWPDRADTPLQGWPDQALRDLGALLNHWLLRPAGTEGYRTAEVTMGGVDTRAISSTTMMANDHPGLFFIGEVLDVTGHLGGYNFQWAWASGVAAGQVA